MLSKYFKIKTKSEQFDKYIKSLIAEMKNKRVVIYGMGEGFVELNKKYRFNECLNITAVSDIKFETEQMFEGMKAVSPLKLEEENFDVIIITNESSDRIVDYIKNSLNIDKEIKRLFVQDIVDEIENITYLENFGFSKHLEKLKKKIKGKKVVIYGAGAFFRVIKSYYNLEGLNIIAISDKRFTDGSEKEFLGYPAAAPGEIKDLNPDYVLVATKMFVSIIEDLYYTYLKGTKIRIKPLMKKDLWTILGEIWTA